MRTPVVLVTGASGELGHGLLAHFRKHSEWPVVTLDLQPLAETEGKLGAIAWAPDGMHIAFLGATDINDPTAGVLYVVPSGGGEEVGVGEKYYLLFNISDHINVPDAYIVFEVSQYDSYAYLFDEPFFVILDSAATPGRVSPCTNSSEAPPPVERWLIRSPTPTLLTAARESPPPTMVTASKCSTSSRALMTLTASDGSAGNRYFVPSIADEFAAGADAGSSEHPASGDRPIRNSHPKNVLLCMVLSFI